MPLPLITVIGYVMDTPKWKPTPAGLPVLHLRLRAVERRRGTDGTYRDGDEYEVEAIAYKDLAENMLASIEVGDPLVCAGRMRTTRWFDARGEKKVRDEFVLAACGPDLSEKPRRHEHVVRAEAEAETHNRR